MDLSSQVGLRLHHFAADHVPEGVGRMDLSSQVGLRRMDPEVREWFPIALVGGMDLSSQVGLRS